jgi:hypothetical protein
LPFGHNSRLQGWGIPQFSECGPLKIPDSRYAAGFHYGIEPLEKWRVWASRAEALLKIAAKLRVRQLGRDEDWICVGRWGSLPPRQPRQTTIIDEWYLLCEYVNAWCSFAHVSPHLSYQGDGTAEIRFGSHSAAGRLFGTLGLQLMVRVSGFGSMAVCSHCARLFTPLRFPKYFEAVYCPPCRKNGVPILMAKRRQTERDRKAHEMLSEGVPFEEIARRLGGDRPARVRRLLKRVKGFSR